MSNPLCAFPVVGEQTQTLRARALSVARGLQLAGGSLTCSGNRADRPHAGRDHAALSSAREAARGLLRFPPQAGRSDAACRTRHALARAPSKPFGSSMSTSSVEMSLPRSIRTMTLSGSSVT